MAILNFGGAEDGVLDVFGSGTYQQSNVYKRSGNYAYRVYNGGADAFGNSVGLYFPAGSTFFFQVGYFNTYSSANNDMLFVAWRNSGTILGGISISNPPNSMKVWLGNKATQIGSIPAGLPVGQWVLIEGRVVIADTGGIIQIKVNGVLYVDYSNQDTKPGTDTTANNLLVGQSATYLDAYDYIDDLMVCDNQGSHFNSWCNGAKIHKCLPTGAGNYSQWTPAGASYNYQCMDDVTPSMDDYVTSTTTGQKDSYAIADAPGGITGIGAVALRYWGQGDGQIKTLIRSGGADYVGPAIDIPGSFNKVDEVHYTAPLGSGWDTTTFNALEVGLEKV